MAVLEYGFRADDAGSSYKDVERAIFLLHLPPAVWTALASSKADSNDALADEANTIFLEHRIGVKSKPHSVSARHLQSGPEVEWIPDDRPEISAAALPSSSRLIPPGCCPVLRRWGWKAFSCKGGSCPLKNEPLMKPPGQCQGNGRAGR